MINMGKFSFVTKNVEKFACYEVLLLKIVIWANFLFSKFYIATTFTPPFPSQYKILRMKKLLKSQFQIVNIVVENFCSIFCCVQNLLVWIISRGLQNLMKRFPLNNGDRQNMYTTKFVEKIFVVYKFHLLDQLSECKFLNYSLVATKERKWSFQWIY